MTGTTPDAGDVTTLVAELAPLWLPGTAVDPAAGTVEVGWGSGALPMSAVVSLGEITDRCLQLPRSLWPVRIEEWLRALVAEGEQAAIEHRYGPVPERVRAVLVQRGWSARTAGPTADALLPFGEYFEVVLFVRTGAEYRRLTVVRRSMLGLGEPDLPSPVELTLAEIQGLEPVEHASFSVLNRPGDPLVSMAVVDRIRMLPDATTKRGLLLGVPRLSTVGFCPADAGQSAADALAGWTANEYQQAGEHLDQCSPDLFWLIQDRLLQLPVTLDNPPRVLLPRPLRRRFRWPWSR